MIRVWVRPDKHGRVKPGNFTTKMPKDAENWVECVPFQQTPIQEGELVEEDETVEVVYSIDSIWHVVSLIILGLWIGFVCGLGVSFMRIESVAKKRPLINGNVTIHSAGKPVTLRGFHIDMAGQEPPAIRVY